MWWWQEMFFNCTQLCLILFSCTALWLTEHNYGFFLATLKIVNALGLLVLPVSSNVSYWLHMHKQKQLLWYKAMNKQLRQKSNKCQILTSLVVCFFTFHYTSFVFVLSLFSPSRRHLLLKLCTMLFCPLKKRHSLKTFVSSDLFWGQSSLFETFVVVVAHSACPLHWILWVSLYL